MRYQFPSEKILYIGIGCIKLLRRTNFIDKNSDGRARKLMSAGSQTFLSTVLINNNEFVTLSKNFYIRNEDQKIKWAS